MVHTLGLLLVLSLQATAETDAGCPPRLIKLTADNGKVMVRVIAGWKLKNVGVQGNRDGTGTRLTGVFPVEKDVELGDLKDLVISTADGTKVSLEDARRKLAGGAIVVVSSDGKAVSSEFLKVFKNDTLVLVSPELVDQPLGGPLGLLPK